MLRRLLRHAEKRWRVTQLLDTLTDSRVGAEYTTATVIKAALIGLLARTGSLHSLAETRQHAVWRGIIKQALPSDDTIGEVFTKLEVDGLRAIQHDLYERGRRSKAFPRFWPGGVAILDGHEVNASYRRQCPGMLQRTITSTNKKGETIERIQYYHAYVYLLLLGSDGPFLLDIERILPHEGELAAARRLLARVCARYPRAFKLVMGDSLYANAPWINVVRKHGKHVLAVLDDERRDVTKDVRGICAIVSPQTQTLRGGNLVRECWDIAQLTSMPGLEHPIRVIRTIETTRVRRQLDDKIETTVSEWMWVCTLSREELDTETAIALGHKRWVIENEEFNELVTAWHGNHIYRNEVNAVEGFQLLLLFAYNLFHLFINRNLQPCLRARFSMNYFANLMRAELHTLTFPQSLSP